MSTYSTKDTPPKEPPVSIHRVTYYHPRCHTIDHTLLNAEKLAFYHNVRSSYLVGPIPTNRKAAANTAF